jgi:hypothetical protein
MTVLHLLITHKVVQYQNQVAKSEKSKTSHLQKLLKYSNELEIIIVQYQSNNLFLANRKKLHTLTRTYNKLIKVHQIEEENLKFQFNDYLQPQCIYNENIHKNHHQLLHLMDKKMRQQIINTGTDYDIARIYALSANGAMSWINLPYNYKWSIEFPNRIFIIAKSLILGNKIFKKYIAK